jgi:anaerobic ribonucleoside-triphosphate reductase activating protein
MEIRMAEFLRHSRVNGPGVRAVIWVSGCPIRCEGCFNRDFWSFRIGRKVGVDEIAEEILACKEISGVTFSGGEPFAQADALGALGEVIRCEGYSVVTFSGFSYRYLRGKQRSSWNRLLSATDLLISGPYRIDRRINHPLLGSGNQEMHLLSDRIRYEDIGSTGNYRDIELVIGTDGEVIVTGFPGEPVCPEPT